MADVATARPDPVRVALPRPDRGRGMMVGSAWLRGGVALAGLTFATHIANLAFTIAGGRLLAPGDFATLTALLGIVLIGMAPGMAVQALTAAGTLGRPVVIDQALATQGCSRSSTSTRCWLASCWPQATQGCTPPAPLACGSCSGHPSS